MPLPGSASSCSTTTAAPWSSAASSTSSGSTGRPIASSSWSSTTPRADGSDRLCERGPGSGSSGRPRTSASRPTTWPRATSTASTTSASSTTTPSSSPATSTRWSTALEADERRRRGVPEDRARPPVRRPRGRSARHAAGRRATGAPRRAGQRASRSTARTAGDAAVFGRGRVHGPSRAEPARPVPLDARRGRDPRAASTAGAPCAGVRARRRPTVSEVELDGGGGATRGRGRSGAGWDRRRARRRALRHRSTTPVRVLVDGRLRRRPRLPRARRRPVRRAAEDVFAWCGAGVLFRPGLPRRRRALRRAVLHVLRGHRPGVAGPGAGLALPLRPRRRCCATCTRPPASRARRCSSTSSSATACSCSPRTRRAGWRVGAVLGSLLVDGVVRRSRRRAPAAPRAPSVDPASSRRRLRSFGAYLRLLPDCSPTGGAAAPPGRARRGDHRWAVQREDGRLQPLLGDGWRRREVRRRDRPAAVARRPTSTCSPRAGRPRLAGRAAPARPDGVDVRVSRRRARRGHRGAAATTTSSSTCRYMSNDPAPHRRSLYVVHFPTAPDGPLPARGSGASLEPCPAPASGR